MMATTAGALLPMPMPPPTFSPFSPVPTAASGNALKSGGISWTVDGGGDGGIGGGGGGGGAVSSSIMVRARGRTEAQAQKKYWEEYLR
jgi:hypothetical protein